MQSAIHVLDMLTLSFILEVSSVKFMTTQKIHWIGVDDQALMRFTKHRKHVARPNARHVTLFHCSTVHVYFNVLLCFVDPRRNLHIRNA